ncbi:MAG: hypothetical protein KDA73_19685 [Rhodobacteraceae bacterium]|nr:hypothetical protein [Paracoccaceae bacterium]
MTVTIPAQPPKSRSLTEIAFCSWVAQALPGDTLAYHRGFLALDREGGRLGEAETLRLRRLADRARWAAETGLVHLVQRRLGPERFVYLAIARRKKPAACVSLPWELRDAA